MIEKVTVSNVYGRHLDLELRHPEKSGYAVTSITGIEPMDVDIKTTQFVSGKRFRYNTGFHKLRNIGINIIFYEYNNAHKRIETLRDELYEYFMTNSFVTLTFCKSGLYYSISGVVDKNQPTIFSQATGASISVTCPELWFYLSDENGNYIKSEFDGDSSLLLLPISTYFPTGMKSAGAAYDELTEKKAITRIAVVDLGTLNWWGYSDNRFATQGLDGLIKSYPNGTKITNFVCLRYTPKIYNLDSPEDKIVYGQVGFNTSNVMSIIIRDTSISTTGEQGGRDFKAAMSGMMLAYELETPVETDVDLSLKYIVDKFGTEQLLPENDDEPTTSPFVGKIQYGEASSVDVNFTFRPSGGSADIGNPKATIRSIHGKTLVWNQLVQNGNFASTSGWSASSGSFSVANNIATFLATAQTGMLYTTDTAIKPGKHLVKVDVKLTTASTDIRLQLRNTTGNITLQDVSSKSTTDWQTLSFIVNNTGNINVRIRIVDFRSGSWDSVQVKNAQMFNVTQIFSAGNEPLTVEEFNALFYLPFYAKNTGALLHFNGTGLKTVGFNQWDEEWENGDINTTTGTNTFDNDLIRSKNYIPVFPNTEYCFTVPWTRAYWYDANKNYIGYENVAVNNDGAIHTTTKTIPANVHYLRIRLTASYGATYKNDICINLSQPDTSKWPHNGDYLAYKEFVEDENTHETVLPSDLIYDGNFETGFIMELSNDDNIINDEVIYIKTKVGEIETGSLSIAPKNLSDGDKLYIDTTDFSLKIYDQDNNNKIEFLEIESLSDRKPLPVIKENVNIIEVYKLDNSTNPPTKIDVPYTMTYNTLYRGL